MNHKSQPARDLRTCNGGKLTETDTVLIRHFDTFLNVIARPEALQSDPLFSRFYTGQRRYAAKYACKESHMKDGFVFLRIRSRHAAMADEAFQRFMAPIRAAAKSALQQHASR